MFIGYHFNLVPVVSTLSTWSFVFEEESEGKEALAGSLSVHSFPRMKTPLSFVSVSVRLSLMQRDSE